MVWVVVWRAVADCGSLCVLLLLNFARARGLVTIRPAEAAGAPCRALVRGVDDILAQIDVMSARRMVTCRSLAPEEAKAVTADTMLYTPGTDAQGKACVTMEVFSDSAAFAHSVLHQAGLTNRYEATHLAQQLWGAGVCTVGSYLSMSAQEANQLASVARRRLDQYLQHVGGLPENQHFRPGTGACRLPCEP